MGVDRTDYIVYGWKLPYYMKINNEEIDWWDEKYEEYSDEKMVLIPDVMSDEYVVFGQLITSADGRYEGWDFVNLDLTSLDSELVKFKYRKLFELDDDEFIGKPTLFIFSAFS